MTLASFVLVLTGVLLNAAAQLLLKAGTNAVGAFRFDAAGLAGAGLSFATEGHILAGLACYAVSVVVWILALSRTEVSIAYPMLAIGYVVNALAAWHLFGEDLNALRVTGILVIVAGVCMVARS